MCFNAVNMLFSICKEDDATLCLLMICGHTAMNVYKSLLLIDDTFTLQMMQDELVTMALIWVLPAELGHIYSIINSPIYQHLLCTLKPAATIVVTNSGTSSDSAVPRKY
jgi:hypothetical protein